MTEARLETEQAIDPKVFLDLAEQAYNLQEIEFAFRRKAGALPYVRGNEDEKIYSLEDGIRKSFYEQQANDAEKEGRQIARRAKVAGAPLDVWVRCPEGTALDGVMVCLYPYRGVLHFSFEDVPERYIGQCEEEG